MFWAVLIVGAFLGGAYGTGVVLLYVFDRD